MQVPRSARMPGYQGGYHRVSSTFRDILFTVAGYSQRTDTVSFWVSSRGPRLCDTSALFMGEITGFSLGKGGDSEECLMDFFLEMKVGRLGIIVVPAPPSIAAGPSAGVVIMADILPSRRNLIANRDLRAHAPPVIRFR
jgi:hypothetical protein